MRKGNHYTAFPAIDTYQGNQNVYQHFQSLHEVLPHAQSQHRHAATDCPDRRHGDRTTRITLYSRMALAIAKAIAWLNRLLEDSLEPQRLLMPATDTMDAASSDMPTVPSADAILAEWQDKTDAIAPTKSDRTIRELKKMASDRAIPKYCNMTKAELVKALA